MIQQNFLFSDYVEFCTGDGGIGAEETRDYCLGWKPQTEPNCTQADEFEFASGSERETGIINADVRDYSGGGYLIPLRGYILDLQVGKIHCTMEPGLNHFISRLASRS